MIDKLRKNVLLVSKTKQTIRVILEILAQKGFRGVVTPGSTDAIEKLTGRNWQLVIADMQTLNGQSVNFLRELKRIQPELPVVACGDDSVKKIVTTIQSGCVDYIPVPIEQKNISAIFEKFLPNNEIPVVDSDDNCDGSRYEIIGQSPAFLNAMELARKIAPTTLPVLVTGESGTGKELVSHYIHRMSARSDNPYICVNCAAISESLLESELFGHEKGSFTGAYSMRKGRFERAHTGTLLLDEISETGPRLQSQLLRVLEQQDFERVGGNKSIQVNVRIISTSNRNLIEEVEKGNFRRDLYYRISGAHVSIPPLRERKEDIEVLAKYFINMYAGETNRRIDKIDGKLLDELYHFNWPGNVRQLRSVIRNSLILEQGPVLRFGNTGMLNPEMMKTVSPSGNSQSSDISSLRLKDIERETIFKALKRTGNKQTKAANLLGITDRTLREKLRRYRTEAGDYQQIGEEKWDKALV